MKVTPTLFIFALILFSPGICTATEDIADGVDLTTIKAPWTLRILGNNLDITNVQAKPDEQSAYFMMTNDSTKLNVSVFIEPVGVCKSGEECREHVLGAGNPAWGKFEGLSKGKLKDFSYFEFYRPEVQSRPVKMLDMYAEYVSDGYWVDLHISKALYTKEDHALFEKVINSINFIPRARPTRGAFDTQLAKGLTTASAWLGLWDKMKCRESYNELSPLTRADNSEVSWIDYCTKVNTTLGANRSRKVIAAAFTRSLPPKTDRPVAIVAYHSNFAGRSSMVEIIGLMQEQNGSWTITNYLPH
jgi:hypothetical protein